MSVWLTVASLHLILFDSIRSAYSTKNWERGGGGAYVVGSTLVVFVLDHKMMSSDFSWTNFFYPHRFFVTDC